MIISLTGASGAGKGTIFKLLHSSNPRLGLVESITTRSQRNADLPGEYIYIAEPEFEALKAENRFLWHVGEHGNAYGTLKTSVDKALSSKEIFFIFLVPEAVKILLDYSAGKIIPIYVLSPRKEKLEQRLKARGENPESVKRRVNDCQKNSSFPKSAAYLKKNIKSRSKDRDFHLLTKITKSVLTIRIIGR